MSTVVSRKEKGERRKEKGERRKEKGERRKENRLVNCNIPREGGNKVVMVPRRTSVVSSPCHSSPIPALGPMPGTAAAWPASG
jgi:hypothetical protein